MAEDLYGAALNITPLVPSSAEGSAISPTAITLPTNVVTTGENAVHDPWPRVSPDAPWTLVNDKFDRTMEIAQEMLVRLVGEDGSSGYLGSLASLISTYSLPHQPEIVVDLTTSAVVIPTRPTPTLLEGIDYEFGLFDAQVPVMQSLPAIDSSSLTIDTPPEDPVGADIVWSESAIPTVVYDAILSRILTDLVSGATGLDPVVEQEMYDRAIARADVANDKMYREIEDYFAARGFELPPGAMAGRLGEAAAEIARNSTEINGQILIKQADLTQKNAQFALQMSIELEKIIRASKEGESSRALDKAKAVADLVVRTYAENIRAYIAKAEAKKANIEAQVAVLQGVIEHNKGLVTIYSEQANAFKVVAEAKAAGNQGLIEGYKAEVLGYEAETKAVAANQQAVIEDNKARIARADIELRRIVAEIDAAIRSYGTEMQLKERISNDMAQLAAQAVAGALNAVSANASIGYSGSESRSESYGHSESISESHSFSTGVSQSVSNSVSTTLSESHNFEHDPLA